MWFVELVRLSQASISEEMREEHRRPVMGLAFGRKRICDPLRFAARHRDGDVIAATNAPRLNTENRSPVATSITNLAAWLKSLGRFGIDLTLQLPF
jgi:hypothetical protein